MIAELMSGIGWGIAILNGVAAYLLYRQYISLAEVSLEFAAVVVESIREQGDGSIDVDPVVLAGLSMDHLSRLGGLVKWIRG
ncbi:MAG: hypothetical protein V1862_12915 [Methanobacteriota archaeon]